MLKTDIIWIKYYFLRFYKRFRTWDTRTLGVCGGLAEVT